jgi:TRAP-type C4-dicarboxylate transport system permease small subunit
MKNLLNTLTGHLSSGMEIIAGVALIGVMVLIGADIVGRLFGCPVPGTYEIVSLAGGLIIGLALPATSRAHGHVSTDFLILKLSGRARLYLTVFTRLIGVGLFLLAGYGTVMMGLRLKASGETTAVLALPFYYVTYAVGGAFFIQTLVLVSEILAAFNSGSLKK